MKWENEKELAKMAVAYFEAMHCDVYQEVAMTRGDRVADLVVRQGCVLHVVEVKRSRTLAVLEQAFAWREFAHRVSVLVPPGRRNAWYFEHVARLQGIGVYRPNTIFTRRQSTKWQYHEWDCLEESVRPALRRRVIGQLGKCLHEKQKHYCAAGSANGGHWSPWRETMDRCVAFIRANPGCTTKQIVEGVDHHYLTDATAKSSIPQWLLSDRFDSIRVEMDGRVRRFYADNAPWSWRS